MNSFEIRTKFFDFFKKLNHEVVPSSSLIPAQDPTLLFTNAGMNQFKDVFLSKEKRSYSKAVSIQKCIRAGGKHNDLENVGFTRRHLTFFEMMGNFSFGDYFKKEAIIYAWDFLTKELKIDKDKLIASVYKDDADAYKIWQETIGLSPSKIIKLGEADNFWQMGETGPCGPCSEIYIDRGGHVGCGENNCAPGCSCDRFLEIWNLVFMEFDKQPDGTLKSLKSPGIDTGMGLERLTSIMQDKESVYETDLFMPIIKKIEQLSGIHYAAAPDKIKSAFRVLADHVRSSSFAIADGVIPSNEGRGYVLRKIIRRALLFSKKLTEKNIFPELAVTLSEHFSSIYPELKNNLKLIVVTLTNETEKFDHNLVQGQTILAKYIQENSAKNQDKIISGDQAFKLYDTYGFPLELTKVIAQESGFVVDVDNFETNMEEQRLRSGKKCSDSSSAIQEFMDNESIATTFTGYDEHTAETTINAIMVNDNFVDKVSAGSECYIITEESPFYVECGGQVSDQGYIKVGDKQAKLIALKKINNAIAALIQAPVDLSVGSKVVLLVDSPTRINTMKNHTATHLLQAALIEVLGKGVRQSGSVVEPDYLRFDFTSLENLSNDQIRLVEDLVNKKIMEDIPVKIEQSTLKEATGKGVIAFFGEKYNPEKVRVVQVPGFSAELCGGTHVNSTGEIGVFKITEVYALSAGNRRIVALTGPKALEVYQNLFNDAKTLSQEFKVPQEQIVDAIKKQREQLKAANDEIKNLRKELYGSKIQEWATKAKTIKAMPFLFLELHDMPDIEQVSEMLLKNKPGFYFVVNKNQDSSSFMAIVSKDFINKFKIKEFGEWLRTQGAQGGGKDNVLRGKLSKMPSDFETSIIQWLEQNSA